jgi:ASC-1-like (ASCH) protein
MSTIKKKAWPEYFELILSGKKKYDMRVNDFDIKEGDTLVFEEWDPETKQYTGRKLEKEVTFVGKWKLGDAFFPEKEVREKGIQIISLISLK